MKAVLLSWHKEEAYLGLLGTKEVREQLGEKGTEAWEAWEATKRTARREVWPSSYHVSRIGNLRNRHR